MNKLLVAVFLVVSGAAIASISNEVDSCMLPNRSTPVCRAMKNLRSHIMVLETQRELAQNNFSLFERTLTSLAQTIYSVLAGSYASVHVEKMDVVKKLTEKAISEARDHNPEVFRSTNQIKVTCQQCHNNSSPEGLKWDEIFSVSWINVQGGCNDIDKNPLVCRQMNALVALFESFESSANFGYIDYEMAAANAREIQRIVRSLISFSHPIHYGGNSSLQKVELQAIELEDLANRKSPLFFERALRVSETCIQCHKVRY